jgi:hypothetical protein
MSDPTSYSESVSNYIKSTPAPTNISAVQYVLGDSNTPGPKSTDVYANFYKTGLESSDYQAEFVLGNSPAAVNKNILPGNRYFIPVLDNKTPGSNKKCYDESGDQHDLSMLIDNVNRTTVITDSSNRGLFYSLYASVKDYEKGISNIDLKKNPYTCKPITAFMDDSGSKKTDTNYVLKSDTEGFIDTAAYKNVKISELNSKTPGSKVPGLNTPGSNVPGSTFNVSNPPLLNSDGTIKTDTLGIPMYENDGTGGGPTQYNVNSQSVKTNQAIMDKLLPPDGTTSSQVAISNMKKLVESKTPIYGSGIDAVSTNILKHQEKQQKTNISNLNKFTAFTTIENSDVTITQHQNQKDPWSDPIFLFYVGSLGLLFGIIFYKLCNKTKG